MATNTKLTEKEQAFLSCMVDVEDIDYGGRKEFADRYREKYGCDPCDACGPDACSSCSGCLESEVENGSSNPFDRLNRRNN